MQIAALMHSAYNNIWFHFHWTAHDDNFETILAPVCLRFCTSLRQMGDIHKFSVAPFYNYNEEQIFFPLFAVHNYSLYNINGA